jgi:formamidopyrimidine-DNA glycosylase
VVPELPEVESVRRQLAPELTGRRIVDVWWDPHPEQRFHHVDAATGHRILDVTRRGKYMILPLQDAGGSTSDIELILHLGMTGSFAFAEHDPARTAELDASDHVRARWHLDDGRDLRFRDPRRFGRVSVVPAGRYELVPTLAQLGPEPLSDDFDVARFAAGLAASHAPVKALLLNQRLVAGVGNIYADEALWRAGIHPSSRRVGRARAERLHAAIREVIAAAIEREGTTFRDYQMVNGESGRYADFLSAYGQGGMPCGRCGTPMRKTVVAQRGTTYCPRCQRA